MHSQRSRENSRWPGFAFGALGGAAAGILISRNFFQTEKKIRHRIVTDCDVGDDTFARTVSQLLGPPLVEGNKVTALRNGARIFPAMLEAIGSAKRTVTLENFVWTDGSVTNRFARALADRAQAGVKVHFLQDANGCDDLWGPSMRLLRDSRVELEIFRFLQLSQFNQRTHRKLLVVDGRIGFIGGVGIADAWDGDADEPHCWRDMQYQVEGPVVAQIQQAFMDNWMQTRAVLLHGDEYFPPLERAGDELCQCFKSSAAEGADSARIMLLFSLAAARRSIRIANPYFIPDDLIRNTIIEACRRGVSVEIITSGPLIDRSVVRMVGRSRWRPLLEAGVRFFEFQTCRYHCKYMIVDECWVAAGSANIDNRSLRINEEANFNVLDADFAKEHLRLFEEDKACSEEVTFAEWRRRDLSEKLLGHAGALLRSQL